MNNISGIYKITSPSGKIYIGQSNNISDRMNRYKGLRCKGQNYLYNSLKKYGWENHRFELLQQLPLQDLNQAEINYIWQYNSTNREVGLNISLGGNNSKHSEETKLLIRANHPKCKKVSTIINGETKIFQSVGDAARQLNTTRRSIKQSIRGNCPKSGYIWNFVN